MIHVLNINSDSIKQKNSKCACSNAKIYYHFVNYYDRDENVFLSKNCLFLIVVSPKKLLVDVCIREEKKKGIIVKLKCHSRNVGSLAITSPCPFK